MVQQDLQAWIGAVRRRGWGDALGAALDVIEPLGPLGAQLLWVAQPVFGLFGAHAGVGALAEALDEPGGIERLRRQLEDDLPS